MATCFSQSAQHWFVQAGTTRWQPTHTLWGVAATAEQNSGSPNIPNRTRCLDPGSNC